MPVLVTLHCVVLNWLNSDVQLVSVLFSGHFNWKQTGAALAANQGRRTCSVLEVFVLVETLMSGPGCSSTEFCGEDLLMKLCISTAFSTFCDTLRCSTYFSFASIFGCSILIQFFAVALQQNVLLKIYSSMSAVLRLEQAKCRLGRRDSFLSHRRLISIALLFLMLQAVQPPPLVRFRLLIVDVFCL